MRWRQETFQELWVIPPPQYIDSSFGRRQERKMGSAWWHKVAVCPCGLVSPCCLLAIQVAGPLSRTVSSERFTTSTWQVPGQQLPRWAWTNGRAEQRAMQFTRNLSNQATGNKPENRGGNSAEHELNELQDLWTNLHPSEEGRERHREALKATARELQTVTSGRPMEGQ